MTDLSAIALSLTEAEPGLWVSDEQEQVSYPSDAHRTLVTLEDDSFWFTHRGRVLTLVLSRYPSPGCVFDVGGGNGYMVKEMRRAGVESILVEPGGDGARAALERDLQPVVNATLATAEFRPGTLPAVGLFDVLEHIEDDAGFLRELNMLLKPGGRLYMTVPAFRWLWSVDDVRAGHFRRYTAGTIRDVVVRSGLELEYSSYFFSVLPLPILLARTIPSLLGARNAEGSRAGEHRRPSGNLGRAFQFVLDQELRWLRRHRLLFGSSLLAVARKGEEAVS